MVVGWGRVGWEKWFRDMTLTVRKSRTYKSSQRSFMKTEASSKHLMFSLPFPALVCSCDLNWHMFSISHVKTDVV